MADVNERPNYHDPPWWEDATDSGPGPNDRCDKCGAHISEWDEKLCVRSLTQSPRHTITRFHIRVEVIA